LNVVRSKRVTVGVVLGIAGLAVVLLMLDRTLFEHKRRLLASDSIRDRICQRVVTTPEGMPTDEWSAAIRWTDNLHANSQLPFQATLEAIREFETALTAQLDGEVDTQTIGWIWNRYAELTRSGRRFNERFQETMHEYIEAAKTEGDIYGEYASFRDSVSRNKLRN